LFSFLKRKPKQTGQVGIAFDSAGFSIAHMLRDPEGRPVLDFCEYIPCDSGPEASIFLANLVRERGLTGCRAISVPPPGAYSLRQIDAPTVDETELRDAARWSVKDLVDFDVAEASIDVFNVPESKLPGRARRVYVVIARSRPIQHHIELLKGSGLRLRAVDILELAFRNLTALLPQDERGVALLYLTFGFGLLTVTRSGSLYLARNLEADLEQLEHAPSYEPGDAKPDTDPEMEQLFNGLLLETHRSLDYYEHQLGQDPVSSLMICPSERPTTTLGKYLRTNLSIDVRELDISTIIECREDLAEGLQVRCLPAIAASLRHQEVAA
jgi:MSHA biogenesis protein MshI